MGAIRGAQVIYNSSLQFAASVPNGVSGQTFTNGVLTGGVPITWAGGSSSLAVNWGGGRTMVLIDFDGVDPVSTSSLQVQVQNQRGNWLQVGSGIIPQAPQAAGMWAVDTIPGQYRVFSNSGLTVGLNIMLTGISYGT